MSDALRVDEQLAKVSYEFEKRFGRRARFAAVAPGRVNLIGEHTDYNDGFVFPMAIQRQTLILADLRPDAQARVASTSQADTATFIVNKSLTPGQPKWANYVKGVVAGYLNHGYTLSGFDALIDTTVPLGGGLSSSASLEMAMATLIEGMTGRVLDPVQKALVGVFAEHNYAGVPCGIMDQFISALAVEGHAMLLDCRTRQTRMVPLDDPNLAVLIANTNVKHELTGGEYAQRRRQCEQAAAGLGVKSLRDATLAELEAARTRLEPVVYRRARHVIGEITRTVQAADAMTQRDWAAVGRLMGESHRSLRDDYEVSCIELDVMVELASAWIGRGVYGSRMTGGGFGGCTVTLLDAAAVPEVSACLHKDYQARTGIAPAIFATTPAPGARLLKID